MTGNHPNPRASNNVRTHWSPADPACPPTAVRAACAGDPSLHDSPSSQRSAGRVLRDGEPPPALPPLGAGDGLAELASASLEDETAPELEREAAEPDVPLSFADEPELPDASGFAEPAATPAPREASEGASATTL